MILNLSSLSFSVNIPAGGTPAWGTEMGQNVDYKFAFEDMASLFIGMAYRAVPDIDNVWCPLGKGGNQQDDYQFVIASLFEKIYVNGIRVKDARFLLLIVKLLVGNNHVGRRTLKYNPRITYRKEAVNEQCFRQIENTLGIANNAAWFVNEIVIRNQDELHFTAYVMDGTGPLLYNSSEERKSAYENCILASKSHIPSSKYRPYITAIKSKPFLLLAGISGTGKSRIVRELARACWEVGSDEYEAQKPKNFEMIQVKPNWHDSSELLGYVSRVSGTPQFIAGDFLRFIVRAWEDKYTPYFLCLDEMNLAPVEQYFAEYLSVVESRKCDEEGNVITDAILKKVDEGWYYDLTASLTMDDDLRKVFNTDGISLPPNLIVVGTVNMDETTFSFSRKVLDRAMTIEMNEVDLRGGLFKGKEVICKLSKDELIGTAVQGYDVYEENQEVCNKALGYLEEVNKVLEKTPFKIAYRTRNEFLLYVVNNLPYHKDKEGNDLTESYVIARALDEITSMKILSRIEGDDTKVSNALLGDLKKTIEDQLKIVDQDFPIGESVAVAKLKEMQERLESGYTSFWSL